jgi:hypothetical protein
VQPRLIPGTEGLFEEEAPPPDMPPLAAQAVHAYTFCQGGRVELVPLYAAVHGLDDWEMVTALFAVIDDHLPPRQR